MRQVGEPSVEEILESIKKVIARDNRSDAAAERRVRESRGVTPPAGEEDEEILDLATSGTFIDELDDGYGDEADSADAAAAAPDAPLVTEDARSSMRDSLAALAMLAEPGAQPQIVRSGETSLEGLTRELLRPALAEWLDKNLPPMVERLVATEIARIVGKKG